MLLMTVAIVAGLSRALGDPLKDYTGNIVSEMVRCIIETGELPQRAFEICDITVSINMNEFRIEKNSPGSKTSGFGTGPTSSASPRSGSNQSNNRDSNGSNSENNSSGSSQRPGRNSIQSRPSSATSSLDSGGFNEESPRSVPGGDFNDVASSGEEDGFKGFDADGGRGRRRRAGRAEGVGGTFTLGGAAGAGENQDLKPADSSLARSAKIKKNADENDLEAPPGPLAFKMDDKGKKRGPTNTNDGEDSWFNFGKLLKWGIIIAILIIFGVFMMNQLNSIRKGWTS